MLTCYIIKDLKRLQNPRYRYIVFIFGPIVVVYWYPTWVLPVGIPHKRLVLYYIKNLCHLRRYARIHKPLKDVMIEIAWSSK